MLHDDKIVKSLSELLTFLQKDTLGIKRPFWYRGLSDEKFDLLPTIYFIKNPKPEYDYLKEFKKDAMLLVHPRPPNSYEWLFLMRHYKIPSRLLDLTESPLIAAFFAVEDEDEYETDGVIWVLLPLELNKYIKQFENEESLPSFEEDKDDLLKNYTTESYRIDDPENGMLPVAFLAPRNSPRMQAQQSVFTIYHHDKTPLQEIENKNHIWRYILPKSSKKNIKNELKLLGVTRFQLFPELETIHEKIEEESND